MDNTFRVVALNGDGKAGDTAATPDLAKVVAGIFGTDRSERLAIERTDWERNSEKRLFPRRKIVVEVETAPNEWLLGA